MEGKGPAPHRWKGKRPATRDEMWGPGDMWTHSSVTQHHRHSLDRQLDDVVKTRTTAEGRVQGRDSCKV